MKILGALDVLKITTGFTSVLRLHILCDLNQQSSKFSIQNLSSLSLNKQSLKPDKIRRENGIISPCLVCLHEGSNQKEKMSHSVSFPIWCFQLWATLTKRGQHSMGF